MLTLRHMRHVGRLCNQQAVRPASQTPSKMLAVPEMTTILNTGEAYQKSYREFAGWLNTGGQAEVYEGASVVGRVVRVVQPCDTVSVF